MRLETITEEIVPKYMPDKLKEGILYVSFVYEVAIHRCACGCGIKTVTPIHPHNPTSWLYKSDTNGPTLSPSIGNYQFPCKSHYFITDGKINWCAS